MQLPVVLLVAGSALALVLRVRAEEGDDCDLQGLPLHATDCCPQVETLLSEHILEAKETCLKIFPTPPHGFPLLVPGLPLPPSPPVVPGLPLPPPPPMVPGLPLPPPPPDMIKELIENFTCGVECVFKQLKLLGEDNKILVDAVSAAFTPPMDHELAVTTKAAIDHCLENLKEDEEDAGDCGSGPRKLMTCVAQQLVLTCPEELATGPMCEEAREKIGKCPDTLVLLHPPKGTPTLPLAPESPPMDA